MKVSFTVGSYVIEVEGAGARECFASLAESAEVFGKACGACGSTNVVPVVRQRDGITFYELRCLDCGAVLAFGQRRDGGALFPRRKDKAGEWLPNNGWVKFARDEAPF
jgi:uncharacterized C2H2 Zn-finger protein